ncbi:hypothetical protein LX59_00431 [Azomonas agilis]|uniref:Outer membrane lipoprotein SlyB n=1 Tax=Azomonas agilis TaxID=116849 RepID=A0A562J3T2_9GAMM|nr:hypothetical protein [Azomonas agilis]TWH77514.1 hypothetical protein LX59_00431 [Azomonas agilis]
MKFKKFIAITLSLFIEGGIAMADDTKVGEIKAEIKDASQGKGYGGLSGVMMGAASGGPVGAVVGAMAGMFAGGTAQHAAAEEELERKKKEEESLRDPRRAYIVHTDEGDIRVRSPNQVFQVGDKVEIVRGRLRALN